MKRGGPLKRKTPMNKVSAKRWVSWASNDGQRGLRYMGYVKQLPCVACGKPGPSEAHHCYHDRYGTRKASDFDVIPLCPACHRTDRLSVHNAKATWRETHGPDHGFIPQVRGDVADIFGFWVD
jgi:hypothetical protein